MPPHVLCFGEIIWDLLPHGRFLGGAPLNVAYHLHRLGCTARLRSAVGADSLGTDALAAMTAAGLPTDQVGRHPHLPTGTAVVELDAAGQARFRLPMPVAWDEVPTGAPDSPTDAIVYGTLALRSPHNRFALERLIAAAPGAWRGCDVNLRAPHDDLAGLLPFLDQADLIKVNADEALRLAEFTSSAPPWPEVAARLAQRFPRADICITLGADGAGVLAGGRWTSVPAPAVQVRDTIGAGDAFTAALVAGYLRAPSSPDWGRILAAACRLGGFVASRDGAQPDYAGFDPQL